MDSLAARLRTEFDEFAKAPNFFIVGAPKCATTTLAASLANHPDVFVSSLKEPHVFGSDLPDRHVRRLMELPTYAALFHAVESESAVGEGSVWYLRSTRAAEEIHEFNASARIIVMLRNPVDMLYSLHGEFLRAGVEDIRDFRSALAAEADRRKGDRIRPGVVNHGQLLYSDAVAYSSQVQRFLDSFGARAVHVVLFDDVLSSPQLVITRVQDFLEVDIEADLGLPRQNEGRVVRSPRLQHFARQQGRLRSVVHRVVPANARHRLSRLVRQTVERVNIERTAPPRMSSQLRAELTERFSPEVSQLESVIQRDLTPWKTVDPGLGDD